MASVVESVAAHYSAHEIERRVLEAVSRAAMGRAALAPAELAPIEELHTRGRAATAELAARAAPAAGARVVDVGCGIGGPARFLAAERGCLVWGLDITPAHVRLAGRLSEIVGLGAKTHFLVGDALSLPFADASFDVAWTQHASMNIADKAAMFAEMARVARAGARLVVYDVVAGTGTPRFPVPWAAHPETSFLVPAEAHCASIERAGFVIGEATDLTAEAIAWFADVVARAAEPPSGLGMHLILGERLVPVMGNLLHNLKEGRLAVLRVIGERAR